VSSREPRHHRPEPGRAIEVPGLPAGTERLQRTLARAGYGSRRSAEDLIERGRVRIEGRIAQLGDKVDPRVDQITVDGVPIPAHPDLRYFAFHKPTGVTTTIRDPHAQRSLAGFLPPGPRVFPVGRLDRESEGLLLLTNDGTLAERLQHPRFGVEKEYLVEVEGVLPGRVARALTRGIDLEDGIAKALRVGPVQRGRDRSAVAIVMGEGRKREVRRMFDAIGFTVRRLIRVRTGPVRLGSLAPGKVRPLSSREVAELYSVAGISQAAPR
jgi:23S rRNA pseudouridine2605 synthase